MEQLWESLCTMEMTGEPEQKDGIFYDHSLPSRFGWKRFFGFSSSCKFIWVIVLKAYSKKWHLQGWLRDGAGICSPCGLMDVALCPVTIFTSSSAAWVFSCLIHIWFHKTSWGWAGCHCGVLGGLDWICVCKFKREVLGSKPGKGYCFLFCVCLTVVPSQLRTAHRPGMISKLTWKGL